MFKRGIIDKRMNRRDFLVNFWMRSDFQMGIHCAWVDVISNINHFPL
jgi:hypothetical protein